MKPLNWYRLKYKHMKNLLILTIVLLLCFSCKPPEARLPESVQSGSFLKASAERNKKLNELEQQQIEDAIDEATRCLEILVKDDLKKAMNRLHSFKAQLL